MNIILFEESEFKKPFSKYDPRMKHVLKILKCGVGDEFDMGIINGRVGKAHIKRKFDDKIELKYSLGNEIPEMFPVTLVVGHPRPRSLRRILREATCLGVSEICFVGTEKGEKSYRDTKVWKNDNFRQLLIDGAQQGFSTRIPNIKRYLSLDDYLEEIPKYTTRICLDNYETDICLRDCASNRNDYILAIGSERGWSQKERQLFREHNFLIARLGERILRTDTACISALSILFSKLKYM